VYVGAGIGAAVMPLRIGERGQREVTVFELGVAPGSFDEHHGVDPYGILRALWANLRAGRVVQGGSTALEQLTKKPGFFR